MLREVEAASSKADGEAATAQADAVRGAVPELSPPDAAIVADRVGDHRGSDAEAAVSGLGSVAAMLPQSCPHEPGNCIRRIDWIERLHVTTGEVKALKEELKILIYSRATLMDTALFTDFGLQIKPNDLNSMPSPG